MDTQHATIPSAPSIPSSEPSHQPVRTIRMQQGWIAVGGAIALIGFFLPWVKSWHIIEMGTDSGFSFAKTTESLASGNSLTILFLVLVAAALAVSSALYAQFRRLGPRVYKTMCAGQLAFAAAALAVIARTVPGEIDTWIGLVIEYQYGIWITVIGLVMVGLGGFVGLISKQTE